MEVEVDDLGEKYTRSFKDMKSIIKHAKLDERNLTQITQAIYYPDENIISDNIKLLEIDDYLLTQITEGKTIQFKGATHEKAVLCTDDKTYELKAAEISNSLLIIPDLKFAQMTSTSPLKSPKPGANTLLEKSLNDSNEDEVLDIERQLERKDVVKIFHEYFECRETKPRFRKLCELLQCTRYSGPENEYCIDRKLLFTYEQLLDTVQCSRKEFLEGLRKCRAIKIDEYMRMLDYYYEFRVISLMLGLISENSWELNEIDYDITVESIEGIIPKEIVEEVFDLYTKSSDIEGKFEYDGEMVAKITAQNILQPGLKFHIDEFLKAWQEALPEGMHIDEKYLRGLGVIDKESALPCVRLFAEENLPINVHDRLRILFQTKKRWTLEELEPYMECFSTPASPVTSILTKYARSMTIDGQRYYVAKHT